MKITFRQIVDVLPSLNKVISSSLPAKTAYRFAKLAKVVKEETSLYDEHRLNVFKKFGNETKNEKGEISIVVPEENMAAFTKELGDLNDSAFAQEFEISFEPVSVDDLGNLQLSALDMVALDKFLK